MGKIHKLCQATVTHSCWAFDPRVEQPARSLKRERWRERENKIIQVELASPERPASCKGPRAPRALAHLVHVPQPAPRPQHLVASPQPLRVPSPQRGHGQVPHEAAAAEQQVLHSTHEHRSHASSFPRNPGVPGSRSCSQRARPQLPDRLGSRRRLLLAAGGQAFHQTRLSPGVLARLRRHAPGLGARQPTAAAGTHRAQCPPRPLAGSAEQAALSSARLALGAPGAREALAGEDSPWRSPSALGRGWCGATLCRQRRELHFSALGLHALHTPHTHINTRARTPLPRPRPSLLICFGEHRTLHYRVFPWHLALSTLINTSGQPQMQEEKKMLHSIPLDPTPGGTALNVSLVVLWARRWR